MRYLAATLALAFTAAPARAADAPAAGRTPYAKLYLVGDRVFEGEVVAEDDKAITLKTELATVPFQRADIVLMRRRDETPEETRARRRAPHEYGSISLAFRLVKPETWSFKHAPPEPLSDILIRRYAEDLEVSVGGMPDASPEIPFDEQALKRYSEAVELKLREKNLDVKRVSAEKTSFKERPAFALEFTLLKKRSRKPYRVAGILVRDRGRILLLNVWGPAPRFEKARQAFEEVQASFEFVTVNRQEGDRFCDSARLFSVEKPPDWTFAKTPDEGAAPAVLRLEAPGRAAFVEIDGGRTGKAPSLVAWSKAQTEALLGSLKDAKKVSEEAAAIGGRFGRRLVVEHAAAGGRVRRTVFWAKDEDFGYQVTAEAPVEGRAFQPVIGEILGRFRVLNDLLTDGAVQRGLQAIERFDEGDQRLFANRHAEAIPLYDQAIDLFPRFVAAWNNKGICLLETGDLVKARQAIARAHDLFGEDYTVKTNLAACCLREALELLDANKPMEAARLVDQAKALAPPDEPDFTAALGGVCARIGIYYHNKENPELGVNWLKRALQIRPKDPELTKILGVACTNCAVKYYNAKDTGKAQTWAQEALKHDPQNAQAKQILDVLQPPKKKRQ